MRRKKTEQVQDLEDSLAEGIASIMAAEDQLDDLDPEATDLTGLYLDELNRLWTEPAPEIGA